MPQLTATTTSDILDALGDELVRSELFGDGPASRKSGLLPGTKALSQARWAGKFPASWYAKLNELCSTAGIPCPLCLFNFKGVSDQVA